MFRKCGGAKNYSPLHHEILSPLRKVTGKQLEYALEFGRLVRLHVIRVPTLSPEKNPGLFQDPREKFSRTFSELMNALI